MPALSLPAWLYARLMTWRETAYSRNWLPRWRPLVPCISVGNIRWGGTGKTPLCLWLLRWAEERKLRPVLLTRGYKAAPPALPYLVRPDSPASEAGDEPLLMALAAPRARVVVDPKRNRSGAWAWSQWRPDLFILDDGFQHLTVGRDLDLVLLLPEDLDADWNRVHPAGPWREGVKALARADVFLIKTAPGDVSWLKPLIQVRLAPFKTPCFSFSMPPRALMDLLTGKKAKPSGMAYILVSAVARPSSVEHSAAALLKAAPARHLAYSDHHPFTPRDILQIQQDAQTLNVHEVVCTAKDAVKIRPLLDLETALHWRFLDMDMDFEPNLAGPGTFEHWLGNWWAGRQKPLIP